MSLGDRRKLTTDREHRQLLGEADQIRAMYWTDGK